MKKLHGALAVAAMFLVIMAVLITSFQVAIYGDPEYRFYEERYVKYEVTDSLHMELPDVMEVTDHMMAYLIGEAEELSIVTDVDGQEQDFFNEQDRLHMADVKNLFLGGLALRTWFLLGAAVLLGALIFMKGDWKRLIPNAFFWALAVFLGGVIFLGIAFTVDFTRCFTIFHEIFFTNDLWIFDPSTDYMIRMLPEGFFFDMVMRIGGVFLGMLLVLGLIMGVWKRKAGR